MQTKQRITTAFIFLCLFLYGEAQQLSVGSFKCIPNDMDARVNYPIVNHNGKKCALIKVENSNSGFVFDTGTLAVEKWEQKVGEIWVYVQPGVRKMTIKHQTLGILREYIFPEQIKEATVYVMKLESGSVHAYVEQAPQGAYLIMRLSPANAIVWIDDEMQTTEEGAVMAFLNNGEHTYRVQAAGFSQEVGRFEINGERKEMPVSLKSNKAVLKLSCNDTKALLYVNGKQVGTGKWDGEFIPGTHIVEVMREGYRTQTKQVELKERENKELNFDYLVAINGFLQVASRPIDTEVWLDGVKVGTTPYGPEKTLVGTHRLELRKAGYKILSKDVVISEGETCLVNNALEKETTTVAASLEGGSGGDMQKFTVKGVSFTMVRVDGGTFRMGSTAEQGRYADSDEEPVHSVTLSSYFIGETEVTQALWKAVMGTNPSYFKGGNLPVETESWNDCLEFIKKLNSLTGRTFRLPTEAEWEFAARGGNKGKGYKYSGRNNILKVAWYSVNSSGETHSVASKEANELGLYDMSGNVYEWCEDWYGNYSSGSHTNPTSASSGSFRVSRGGSWYDNARNCRVSNRNGLTPGPRRNTLGLRLVLVP